MASQDGTRAASGIGTPAIAKRRSREEISRLIVDAARVSFEANGYDGATTAAIAAAGQVTEAQLFRYFRSKADLFRAAVIEPLDASFAAFNERHLVRAPAGGDAWRMEVLRYITELQEFIGTHHRALKTLIVADAYDPGGKRGIGRIGALTEYFALGAATMRANQVAPSPSGIPDVLVRVSFATVLATVLFRDWLFPDGLADDADVARTLVAFVTQGLGAHDRDEDRAAAPVSPRSP